MTASVTPLRPEGEADEAGLYGEYQALAAAVLDDARDGRLDMQVVCRLARAYEAWVRAYAGSAGR